MDQSDRRHCAESPASRCDTAADPSATTPSLLAEKKTPLAVISAALNSCFFFFYFFFTHTGYVNSTSPSRGFCVQPSVRLSRICTPADGVEGRGSRWNVEGLL